MFDVDFFESIFHCNLCASSSLTQCENDGCPEFLLRKAMNAHNLRCPFRSPLYLPHHLHAHSSTQSRPVGNKKCVSLTLVHHILNLRCITPVLLLGVLLVYHKTGLLWVGWTVEVFFFWMFTLEIQTNKSLMDLMYMSPAQGRCVSISQIWLSGKGVSALDAAYDFFVQVWLQRIGAKMFAFGRLRLLQHFYFFLYFLFPALIAHLFWMHLLHQNFSR